MGLNETSLKFTLHNLNDTEQKFVKLFLTTNYGNCKMKAKIKML